MFPEEEGLVSGVQRKKARPDGDDAKTAHIAKK